MHLAGCARFHDYYLFINQHEEIVMMFLVCVRACVGVRACVHACMRACVGVRACVRACVGVCVCVHVLEVGGVVF